MFSFPAPNVTKLYGRALSHHEIELRWDQPESINGNLKPYEVYCVDLEGNLPVHIWTTNTIVIVPNLLNNTLYKCTLKASTYPEKGQNPKDCEILVNTHAIITFDYGKPKVTQL